METILKLKPDDYNKNLVIDEPEKKEELNEEDNLGKNERLLAAKKREHGEDEEAFMAE